MTRRLVTQALRLLAGAFLGALVGLVAFLTTRLTGRPLFMLIGAVTGVVTALALQLYNRTVELAEVRLTVPQLSELTFVVTSDARRTAWKLYVETATRIATQPLGAEEGFLREALNSLYALFTGTREVLKEAQPSRGTRGPTVEQLAITMLNRELRPFLAKWHPRLSAFERAHPGAAESAWEENEACRAELRAVQARVVEYALGFARLAGVEGAEAMLKPPPR